jgi:uncharacterized damage-inducible protein DinB
MQGSSTSTDSIGGPAASAVSADEYLYFTGRALEGMSAALAELGDDLANRRPALCGGNSPYAVLTHCLGVVDYWAGTLVAGREVHRDRDAEFSAAGPVAPLLARAAGASAQLAADVAAARWHEPLRAEPPAEYLGPDRQLTQGGALLHVLEELAQHHGQVQVLRDALLSVRA